MVLPIYAYGHPVLRKVGVAIEKDYPELDQLIENMWETMYHASGVGLAAPQVGLAIRLFVVDTLQVDKKNEPAKGIKKAFINPQILNEAGDFWSYEEGCLSIPKINGDVERQETITISYFNEKFEPFTETYDGMNARVIQHEYDHIEGKLFIELLSPIKKKLISRKLENIRKGKISADYVMRFV